MNSMNHRWWIGGLAIIHQPLPAEGRYISNISTDASVFSNAQRAQHCQHSFETLLLVQFMANRGH